MSLTPDQYRWITRASLVSLCVIVVSGAAVRLTGSGLGCVDWPNCNRERLVDVSTFHAAVEQINRLFTGVVAVAVIVAVLGARVRQPQRRDLTLLAYGLVAGVVAQILLGALLIEVELHPISVQGHFLLSMVLVANAVVLVHRAGRSDGDRLPIGPLPVHRALLGAATAVALVTGTVVTGAGPHAGDEDVVRLDLAIPGVARIHSISVLVAVAIGAALALRLQRQRSQTVPASVGLLSSWTFVALLQGAIGYVQYFNNVPELLVGVHVHGATVLWAITVALVVAQPSPSTALVDREVVRTL